MRLSGSAHSPREYNVDGTAQVIVMQAGGDNLEQASIGGDVSLPTVLLALAQSAKGLHVLHNAGVNHGDVRPSHMVEFPEGWKLVGLGQSRRLGDELGRDELLRGREVDGYTPPEWRGADQGDPGTPHPRFDHFDYVIPAFLVRECEKFCNFT